MIGRVALGAAVGVALGCLALGFGALGFGALGRGALGAALAAGSEGVADALTLVGHPVTATAKAWIDQRFPPGTVDDGIRAEAWTGKVRAGGRVLQVTRIASVSACRREALAEPELCATLITDEGGRALYRGDTCGDVASWSFARDGLSFKDCGDENALER